MDALITDVYTSHMGQEKKTTQIAMFSMKNGKDIRKRNNFGDKF